MNFHFIPTLISYHEAPFSIGNRGLCAQTQVAQKQPAPGHHTSFRRQDSPIFGGLAQFIGGSGGRPLCRATTAEPLHTECEEPETENKKL